MNRAQQGMLAFAQKYPDKWHSYARDKETVDAVRCLEDVGYVHDDRVLKMFKITSFAIVEMKLKEAKL